MKPPRSAKSRDRILFHLKTRGPKTASELAKRLGVTPVAVRQQLQVLADEGLVRFEDVPAGVGRPRRVFELTEAGSARFPEGYAELALDLVEGVRAAFGPEGLEALVERRTAEQVTRYLARIPDDTTLAERVRWLARIRDEEGYMAEVRRTADGSFTLVENHCPICAAAEVCPGLCAGEETLFRHVLGRGVRVEREEYLFGGARRCTYRIRSASM